MGETTEITWTDHTFNPWQGCARVSPGCQNCYAEALSKRVGHPERWGKGGTRDVTSDNYWRQPIRWNARAGAAGRQEFVFCASLADVFEDRPDLEEPRWRLWALIAKTPHLTWQLLTKRPENILKLVPSSWMDRIEERDGTGRPVHSYATWPRNVWVGTTVEDQQRAEERIPELLEVPAPVRFLSCEPLLGPVVFRSEWLPLRLWGPGQFVDWVICGGESGAQYRPLNLDHARSLRRQCELAGVPFWFKQVGGLRPKDGGDLLDGTAHHERPSP